MSESKKMLPETSKLEMVGNDAISRLEEEFETLDKFISNTESKWQLLVVKLKKERLKAVAALTRSKMVLAEMQIFIAETELSNISGNPPKKPKTNPYFENRERSESPKRKQPAFRSSTTPKSYTSIPKSSSSSTASSPTSAGDGCRSKNTYHAGKVGENKKTDISKDTTISAETLSYEGLETNEGNIGSKIPIHDISTLPPTPSSSSLLSDIFLNQTLTKSILAEFDKPYLHEQDNDSLLNVNSTKSSQNIKIKPVSNTKAYNNALKSNRSSQSTAVAPKKFTTEPTKQGKAKKNENNLKHIEKRISEANCTPPIIKNWHLPVPPAPIVPKREYSPEPVASTSKYDHNMDLSNKRLFHSPRQQPSPVPSAVYNRTLHHKNKSHITQAICNCESSNCTREYCNCHYKRREIRFYNSS